MVYNHIKIEELVTKTEVVWLTDIFKLRVPKSGSFPVIMCHVLTLHSGQPYTKIVETPKPASEFGGLYNTEN